MTDTSFEEFEENNHEEVDNNKGMKQKIIIGVIVIIAVILAVLSLLL